MKQRFNKDDYMLSFSVEGVSVFVTDIHREAYADLEVLYIIDHGLFKQYFTKKAFQRALDNGLKFYSNKAEFDNFQKELNDHCKKFKLFFASDIKGKNTLSSETLQQFFDYTVKLCKEYAKMNFEYTDKAFTFKEKNKVIEDNLKTITTLKDEIRAFMNTVLFEEEGYALHIFKILSNQFSIEKQLPENLTQKELLDLFKGKMPNPEAALKRQEAFISTYDNLLPYERESARTIAKDFEEKITKTSQIIGQTASQGKISGRVKIIPVDYGNLTRMNTEIGKMQQGDILVAKTTAPELIIACKKAGAIITDMGGLLSHAAIVSREFGIPCIVGTGNATSVLKDGDQVEVDATQGIVKIMKRSE